jgi:hypothetical protein
MLLIIENKQTLKKALRFNTKRNSMIKNFISFNNLVARISECRKKITMVRHELLLDEESGHDSDHHKRELFNLSNQISLLQSKLQDFQNKARVNLF